MAVTRAERAWLWLHRTLDKRLSRLGVAVFRRSRGSLARRWDVDALLLTTTGRRSGRARTVVLQYFRDGSDLIVVAADAGADRNPAWYHNLLAEPRAHVEIEGRSIEVEAAELPPEASQALWPRILDRAPDYERYVRATERAMPLLRLRPLTPATNEGTPKPPSDG
jgi:deazaflavin-dependent oxidoreductase (nitroreductase family)